MGRCLFPTCQQLLPLPSPHLHLPFCFFTDSTWYCLFWASRFMMIRCSSSISCCPCPCCPCQSMLICPSLGLCLCQVSDLCDHCFPPLYLPPVSLSLLYVRHSFMTDLLYFSVRILSPPLVLILRSYLLWWVNFSCAFPSESGASVHGVKKKKHYFLDI